MLRMLERFRAKACPGLDPGWMPVRVKKTRQIFPTGENIVPALIADSQLKMPIRGGRVMPRGLGLRTSGNVRDTRLRAYR